MKTFWLQIGALVVLIFAALFVTVNREKFLPQTNPFGNLSNEGTKAINITDISSGNLKATVNAEIADTKEKRSKGLEGKDSLEPDSGMLFVFDNKDTFRFWMKGMKFPLDFIWISGDKVVDLLSNVLPPETGQSDDTLVHLAPVVPVDKVLEVNANFIRDHNIAIGDKIGFEAK